MPVTALTMLVGVLAISGAPLLSGWYSKDMVLGAALTYAAVHPHHALLFVLPAVTALMTAYYMFRLWFLAFTGAPRDAHVHDRAHESPAVMTLPLVVLAAFSVGVAWGWPVWDAHASYLAHVLEKAEPANLNTDFVTERVKAHDYELLAGGAALAMAAAGTLLAAAVFYWRTPAAAVLNAPGPAWYRFLLRKWYFDEAYDAALVTPTLALARAAAAADKRPTDAPAGAEPQARRFDLFTLDGALNAVGQAAGAVGGFIRGAQNGRVRSYVLALALTAAVMLGMLAVLSK
jgi:NADH-quinone oxidoreductase subunit L